MLSALKFNEKNENAKFLPLSQRLTLKTLEPINHENFKEMPYDFHCPTVQSQLTGRVCATCGLYFASKKAMVSHVKALNYFTCKTSKKLKLTRIEAQRKEEVLCVLREKNTKCANEEWVAENEIDEEDLLSCVDNRSDIQVADSLPIIQMTTE